VYQLLYHLVYQLLYHPVYQLLYHPVFSGNYVGNRNKGGRSGNVVGNRNNGNGNFGNYVGEDNVGGRWRSDQKKYFHSHHPNKTLKGRRLKGELLASRTSKRLGQSDW